MKRKIEHEDHFTPRGRLHKISNPFGLKVVFNYSIIRTIEANSSICKGLEAKKLVWFNKTYKIVVCLSFSSCSPYTYQRPSQFPLKPIAQNQIDLIRCKKYNFVIQKFKFDIGLPFLHWIKVLRGTHTN